MAHSLFQGYGRLFAVVAILFVAGVLYYCSKGDQFLEKSRKENTMIDENTIPREEIVNG